MTAKTLEDALRGASADPRLVGDGVRPIFALDDGVGALRWPLRDDAAPPPAALEADLVTRCVLLARRWTGVDVSPMRARLRRRRPTDLAPYAVLGCALEFEAPITELLFSNDTLRTPLLACPLKESVLEAFERVGTEQSAVAEYFGWSRRTLQRRLLEEGIGHQALVDEHRRRGAYMLMKDRSRSIVQIAHECGFSDAGAFRRALRRWARQYPEEAPIARGRIARKPVNERD